MHLPTFSIRALLASAAILVLFAGCDGSAASATRPLGLVFENADAPRPYFHDFGDSSWGQTIAHTFRLVNREGRAVVVQDLLPDCGCTIPRAAWVGTDGTRVEGPLVPRGMNLSVPDGATLEVAIALDTKKVERPNQHKLAQVRLRCDSAVTPYLTFELHTLVKRTFIASPAEAILSDVPLTHGKSVRVNVGTDQTHSPARIRGVEAVEGPFQATIETHESDAGMLWVLVVEAPAGLTHGAHVGKVVLGTTLDDGTGVGQPFEIHVRGQVVDDTIIEPRVIAIPRDGSSANAMVRTLVPGARVRVRGVRAEGGASESLRVTFEAVEADDDGRAARWKITVEPLPEAPATAFSGKIVAELDDPLLPRIEVPYAAPPR